MVAADLPVVEWIGEVDAAVFVVVVAVVAVVLVAEVAAAEVAVAAAVAVALAGKQLWSGRPVRQMNQ